VRAPHLSILRFAQPVSERARGPTGPRIRRRPLRVRARVRPSAAPTARSLFGRRAPRGVSLALAGAINRAGARVAVFAIGGVGALIVPAILRAGAAVTLAMRAVATVRAVVGTPFVPHAPRALLADLVPLAGPMVPAA
jgi:hypothetical protein